MAAMFKLRAVDGADVRHQALARTPARPVAAPAAVLAHGAGDRFRIRLDGRQAAIYLKLAAAEIASHPDLFRIRINPASKCLVLWVRLGSDLEGDGERVRAVVDAALNRIALGQRSCAAPIDTAKDDAFGLGLSLLKAVAL